MQSWVSNLYPWVPNQIFRGPENFKECVMRSWKYEASASGPTSHKILAQEFQPHLTCHGWMEAGGGLTWHRAQEEIRMRRMTSSWNILLLVVFCWICPVWWCIGAGPTHPSAPCRFVIRVILILPAVTFSVTPPLALLCPPLASVATL